MGNSLRPLIATVGMSAAKFAYIAHVLGVILASRNRRTLDSRPPAKLMNAHFARARAVACGQQPETRGIAAAPPCPHTIVPHPNLAVAPLSSWVGVQIGYLAGAYSSLGPAFAGTDPFVAFLSSIPYRFFPLSMLAFVVGAVVTVRASWLLNPPPTPAPPSAAGDMCVSLSGPVEE